MIEINRINLEDAEGNIEGEAKIYYSALPDSHYADDILIVFTSTGNTWIEYLETNGLKTKISLSYLKDLWRNIKKENKNV